MTLYADQIRIHVRKFEAALTTMAWGIAEKVFEEQRKRLVSELNDVATKAEKPTAAMGIAKHMKQLEKRPFRVDRTCRLLDSKKGVWDRGSGAYKVIGPGKEPETFDLENVATGKKINATLKTLAFRWRHTP